jgi:hypothetical protein
MSVSPIRTDDREPFIRLAEGFLDHPDVLYAGPLAMYLHICAIAWCHRNNTDGRIPVEQIGRLVAWDTAEIVMNPLLETRDDGPVIDVRTLVEKLVEAEIWLKVPEGQDYLIVKYFAP